jgi:hypothetical protein
MLRPELRRYMTKALKKLSYQVKTLRSTLLASILARKTGKKRRENGWFGEFFLQM